MTIADIDTTSSRYDNSSIIDCSSKHARKQNMGQILIATKQPGYDNSSSIDCSDRSTSMQTCISSQPKTRNSSSHSFLRRCKTKP